MKQTKKEPNGTSFWNSTIKATVNELIAILGKPLYAGNDGEDKVNFEWHMETNKGDIFTIYDWKEYRVLDENETIEWHIGGMREAITTQAQAELAAALTVN